MAGYISYENNMYEPYTINIKKNIQPPPFVWTLKTIESKVCKHRCLANSCPWIFTAFALVKAEYYNMTLSLHSSGNTGPQRSSSKRTLLPRPLHLDQRTSCCFGLGI
ncbi:hypothetical protein PoB_003808900 [Plakobranchus ocellatus]|uniref:Uncharacterized protein n=1 Tax=Plakobranchus ocellatus TaxID=259542 RepID=A0AAV4AUW6_9GAST|nr:hypothetical protein PoB_003808900 [Plakobranchus ocellatus]